MHLMACTLYAKYNKRTELTYPHHQYEAKRVYAIDLYSRLMYVGVSGKYPRCHTTQLFTKRSDVVAPKCDLSPTKRRFSEHPKCMDVLISWVPCLSWLNAFRLNLTSFVVYASIKGNSSVWDMRSSADEVRYAPCFKAIIERVPPQTREKRTLREYTC